jgi:DNA-binding transcriptional LysR family regulator
LVKDGGTTQRHSLAAATPSINIMGKLSDIHAMHINDLDLNLLRLFDAVYRTRNVSRAAQLLELSQPAASQGLTRLRLALKDALFVRTPGGVRPTPRADRLAQAVQSAIGTLEQALAETESFDPRRSQMTLRLHLSDIGEARFLPALLGALHESAPGVRVTSQPWPHGEIAPALDSGTLDFAIGFLPSVHETQTLELVPDRYVVLVREDHPVATRRRGPVALEALQRLDYVAVRSHSETLRILQLLRLEDRIRLTASHFLALPAVVRSTDLAVVMPHEIARGFAAGGGYRIIEPALPLRDFTVSLHWSRRFEHDPSHRWLRELMCRLFKSV